MSANPPASMADMQEPEAAARQAAMYSTMRTQRIQDFIFHKVTLLFAASVMLVLVGIIISLVIGATPAFRAFGPGFITSVEWDPVNEQFGALIAITGTLVTSFIALLIAFPISFGIALFLTEICPVWLRRPMGTAVELLAGVPSIIYGMWGLFVFVPIMGKYIIPWLNQYVGDIWIIGPLFRGPPLGLGMLTAGIVLAIMVIPFISSVMREVFLTVPTYTRTAVIGGIFLGLGRALGETMAVTFVLGNVHRLSISLLEPGNSIAATIANEFAEADSEIFRSSLIALAFLLFVVTFIVLAIAKLMLRRMEKREGNA
jgi:phosphate transport system permease protein